MITILGNEHDDQSSNLDETVCILCGTNILGKSMNPTFLPSAMGK